MLTAEMVRILEDARTDGWVLEPEAKRFFALAGLDVPRFAWAKNEAEAVRSAEEIGYPLVAKVVSPAVLHKSDVRGVRVGVPDARELAALFREWSGVERSAGMLVEEIGQGRELIVGAKNDFQFGPIILLGSGGTGVEIFRDVALAMAPLEDKDALAMVGRLKTRPLLEGYRGAPPIAMEELTRLLVRFSRLALDLETRVESIDLNPVLCSSSRAVVADARIILKTQAV
jgi:succinyl-CoA synthetase beta subunit